MQYHKIRLNEALSGTSVPFRTSLRNFNDYYVYGNVIGGGIVTQFNVRSFLNDSSNQVIIDDFIAYLSGSTTSDELVQILGDNQRLAIIFNHFYETAIMSGIQTGSQIIANNLSDVGPVQFQTSEHVWNGTSPPAYLENIPMSINGSDRTNDIVNIMSRFSIDDGYHIPVFIANTYQENSRYSYDQCPTRIHRFLNPDAFISNVITDAPVIERIEEPRGPDPLILVNGSSPNPPPASSLSQRFSIAGNELVQHCYDSQCVDNRYCDLLYFANTSAQQTNAINTEHVRGLLGGEPSDITDDMVLDALLIEMSQNGTTLNRQVFACMLNNH